MKMNKLVLKALLGGALLTSLSPIVLSASTNSSDAASTTNNVAVHSSSSPKTALQLWEQQYAESLKESYKNMVKQALWDDFEGGLTTSQVEYLNAKIDSMNFANYKELRKEIFELSAETKEAFSRLISYTFGGTYFNDLMKNSANQNLNETIQNGFDSLRIFSREELMQDAEYKEAFTKFQTTANDLFAEMKNGNNLNASDLEKIVKKALKSKTQFFKLILSKETAEFAKLKDFVRYHNYMVDFFYKENKTKVQGNPNNWTFDYYFVGLVSNWTMLIGNLANDAEIDNLLYHYNPYNGTNDSFNHFLEKTSTGVPGENFKLIQNPSWFVDSGTWTLYPKANFNSLLALSKIYYENPADLSQSTASVLDKINKGMQDMYRVYNTNRNGHKYFITNFNFNPADMPVTIYMMRRGTWDRGANNFTGEFYGKKYNQVTAWKTEALTTENGWFFGTLNQYLNNKVYDAIAIDKTPFLYDKFKGLDGAEKLNALQPDIDALKAELAKVKQDNPTLNDIVDKWLADIEKAKESGIIDVVKSVIDKNKYIKDSIATGAIGDPAASKLQEAAEQNKNDLAEGLKVLAVFDKLNSKASGIVDAIDHYKEEIKEDADPAGIASIKPTEIAKINELSSKVVNGKFTVEFPEGFDIKNPDSEALTNIVNKLGQEETTVKRAVFDVSKVTYDKLIKELTISSQNLKDQALAANDALTYEESKFKANVKPAYKALKERADQLVPLYNDINSVESIGDTTFDPEAAALKAKYDEALAKLNEFGKNTALAKSLVDGLLSEKAESQIKDAFEKYEEAKEDLLDKLKEDANKEIEALKKDIDGASSEILSGDEEAKLLKDLNEKQNNIKSAQNAKTISDNLTEAKNVYNNALTSTKSQSKEKVLAYKASLENVPADLLPENKKDELVKSLTKDAEGIDTTNNFKILSSNFHKSKTNYDAALESAKPKVQDKLTELSGKISAIPNELLTAEQKAELNNKILAEMKNVKDANDFKTLLDAIEKGKEFDASTLKLAKENANKKLDELNDIIANLSDKIATTEQKQEFTTFVENAKGIISSENTNTIEEIANKLKEATDKFNELQEKVLPKVKEDSIKALDKQIEVIKSNEKLPEDYKKNIIAKLEKAKQDVNAATQIKDVNPIEKAAIEKSNQEVKDYKKPSDALVISLSILTLILLGVLIYLLVKRFKK